MSLLVGVRVHRESCWLVEEMKGEQREQVRHEFPDLGSAT